MNININNYIESLQNPDGRFRTLSNIYVLTDHEGIPTIKNTSFSVDFEVIWEGAKYLLSCLRNVCEEDRQRMREASTYSALTDSRHISEYQYLEQEMVVFDNFDRPTYTDLVIQRIPEGVRSDIFLAQCLGGSDYTQARQFIKGLSELAVWMYNNQFSHGKITSANMWVTENGCPILTDFSNFSRHIPQEDLRAIGIMVVVTYISICESGFSDYAGKQIIAGKTAPQEAKVIFDKIYDDLPTAPQTLLNIIYNKDEVDTQALCTAIQAFAELEPVPIAAVRHIVGSAETQSSEQNNAPSCEGLSRYAFVGSLNDMVMRVWDGKVWKYVDKYGKPAIPGTFLDTTDFCEGRAVVETETGYGLIDREGRMVIPALFDDMEWDSIANLAIVTREGMSGLFSREGEQVTELIYDHILNVNEGLAAVKKDGRYGYITRDGETAIEFIYDDAFGFRDGMARVRLNGREYIIDRSGNTIDEILEKMPVPDLSNSVSHPVCS